jgi:hypothetical protein
MRRYLALSLVLVAGGVSVGGGMLLLAYRAHGDGPSSCPRLSPPVSGAPAGPSASRLPRWSDEWLESHLNRPPELLAKIQRTPPTTPTLTSDAPLFILAVFGQEAQRRAWFIVDGTTLYVDRNGDGEMFATDESMPLQALADEGPWTASRESATFSLLPTSVSPAYAGVRLVLHGINLEWKCDQDNLLDLMSAARTRESPHLIWLYVDSTPRRQFAVTVGGQSPGAAPVLHFDGPRTLGVAGLETKLTSLRLRRGHTLSKPTELQIAVGTPGLGRGSWVTDRYGAIPRETTPHVRIEFLGTGTQPLAEMRLPVPHRC